MEVQLLSFEEAMLALKGGKLIANTEWSQDGRPQFWLAWFRAGSKNVILQVQDGSAHQFGNLTAYVDSNNFYVYEFKAAA